jgi:hypothetical protein
MVDACLLFLVDWMLVSTLNEYNILYINSLVCLWHDNSAAKAFYGRTGLCIFYGRTGLCIILALRVVVAKRHMPAIDRVVTTVY